MSKKKYHHLSSENYSNLDRTLQPNLPLRRRIRPIRKSSLVRSRSTSGLEGLFEISDDVVDVFGADGDTDRVFGDARVELFLVGELFVRGGPWVDGEGFGVADAVCGMC